MTRHGRRPCIGILREVKNQWERRAPLIPKDVAALVASGIDVLVQPSERRVFKDVEYREAGAVITNDLTAANTIFGVKEVPADNLIPGRNYVIFSHVIKAQPDNMPFLDACLAKNVRLFDYECIRDPATSTRLVAFGRFAGNAGMIDILRGCGHRFLTMGMSTPFLAMPSAYMHASLDQAKENVVAAGREVARVGLPKALTPLTFAFTGAGNVTQGAMDIFKLLPHEYVDVDDLAHLRARGNADPHKVYGVHLKTSDLVAPVEPGATFDREHYYENPHLYRPVFHERVLPNVTVLVNGIYWDHRFPRLLTAEQLKDSPTRNLAAIADISCDIGGSIQFLEKATAIDDPFVVYNPSSGTTTTDLNDDGILLLAVDNLPAELPREASGHFSSALVDFASVLSTCAADQPFDECALPDELRAACITSNGALCHEYDYISELRRSMESSRPPKPHASAVLSITGHLFDTGLINRVLDVIELCGGGLTIHQMAVDSNRPRMSRKSNAVVEISGHDSEHIAAMSARVTQLAESLPSAEAVVTALPSNGRAASSRAPAMPASIPAVKKRVVLLGSGLVAGPCVDVLTSYDDIELVIGSDNLQQAEALARRSKGSRVAAVQIDADDFERGIRKLVQGGAAVISLLPAHLHAKVARLCIDVRTDMITASYVSPELAKLHTAAQEAGIVVLNECGLDPGLDHMSAMKMIDEIKGTGGSVVSFESTCGGLPAPEAADNPFMYKFSWSPRGALLAALNAAVYRQNGEVIAVEGKDLLRASRPLHLSPALRLEHTPNRNSLIYESEYGVEESVQSFYRGTIRYAGYSSLLYCMAQLGLLSSEARADLDGTWPALLSRLTASADLASFLEGRGVSADDAGRCVSALRWLGMLDSGARVDARDGTVLDAFVAVLRPRLSFGPNERDLVILQHRLSVAPHGGTTSPVTKVSTLVQYGNPFGDSAMAQTVGVTAALAARLVLDGGVAKRGVVKPTTPDVYNPVLDMAADRGIRFVETTTAARHNL